MSFTFLNEPIHRWIVFFVIMSLVAIAWNGILREMS